MKYCLFYVVHYPTMKMLLFGFLVATTSLCAYGHVTPTAYDQAKVLDHLTFLEQTILNLQKIVENQQKSTTAELEVLRNEFSAVKQDLRSTSEELHAAKKELKQLRSENQKLASQLEFNYTRHTGDRLPSRKDLQMNVVKFQVQLSQPITAPILGAIRFDRVLYNTDNAYNVTSGIYTAPVSGSYSIWTDVVMAGRDAYMELFLFYNGGIFAGGLASTAPENTFDTASITTVMYLKKGDEIWIAKGVGTEESIFGASYSAFGGTLLSAC